MLDNLTLADIQELYPEYGIEYHLFSGGQKEVYKGSLNGQDIVFKLLPVPGDGEQERGEREVEAMQRISNPHLVDLIEHFYTEIEGTETLVLVEEFLTGGTLRDCIRDGSTSLEFGMDVGLSLLDLLGDFHEEEIVHRDIKPENIIIQPDGELKLLDVGIARFLTKSSLTPSFAQMGPGTPNYAAPEQLENKKGLQDVKTDIFSTGIVLFQAITGEHPYEVEGFSIPNAILHNRKLDFSDYGYDPGTESELDRIYKRMTNPEPFQRYRKPKYASDDLEKVSPNVR